MVSAAGGITVVPGGTLSPHQMLELVRFEVFLTGSGRGKLSKEKERKVLALWVRRGGRCLI